MPRARSGPLFELAGQWVGREPGRANLYRFWNDPGTGRQCRESLGTGDLEKAKLVFAKAVLQNAPKTPNSPLAAVLVQYFTERTDKLPSKKQSRNAGKILLRCWGQTMKANAITDAKQKEFAIWSLEQGFGLPYVARNLTVLKAALNHAGVTPPAKIVTTESTMRDRWGLTSKAPRKVFIPGDDELARVLQAKMPEKLRRWMIISLLTACRPEAALDVTPSAWRRGIRVLELNPPGRAQNKKFRPIVRVPRVLAVMLEQWEKEGVAEFSGRFCGYTTIEGVKTALDRVVSRPGMPPLSTYSFRHKAASVLRQSRVPEDQISVQLGHKRKDLRTTAGYGEFSPDYLKDASRALDAWALKLRRLVNSHGIPTNVRTLRKAAA
jgi:integrase